MAYKRWIIGCLNFVIICIVLSCASLYYSATRPSADDQLLRLTQLSQSSQGRTFAEQEAAARQALLQQLPVGTTEADIYRFLESRGATRLQVPVQGQLMSYSPKDRNNIIQVMLEDAPDRLSLVCRSHYIIQLKLNSDQTLQDITVENFAACL